MNNDWSPKNDNFVFASPQGVGPGAAGRGEPHVPAVGPAGGAAASPAVAAAVGLGRVAAVVPPPADEGPDAAALLKALRRRWALALSLGLAAGATAAASAWSLIPPAKYTARAILHVSTTPPKLVFDHDHETDYRTFQQTQVALINSRMVLSAALADPAVKALPTVAEQPDPMEWLEKTLAVKFPGGSEILEISLGGDRAHDLPVIVNAVAQSYLYNMVEKETNDRRHKYGELKKIYDREQQLLESKRKGLKKLAESVGTGDRATQELKHQLALNHLNKMQGEILQVESELRRAQVEEASVRAAALEAEREVPRWKVDARVEQDATVQALRSKAAAARRQFDQVAGSIRGNDPARVAALQRVRAAAKELDEHRQRLAALVAAQLADEEGRPRREQLAEARERVSLLSKYKDVLAAELKALGERDHAFNRETLDFQALQDEIQLVNDTAKKVGTLMQSIDVEVQAPARIRLLDPATTPQAKDDKKRVRIAGAAGLGALVIVVLGVSLLEYQARRVATAEEVVRTLGVRLMGVLPAFAARDRRSWVPKRPGEVRDPLDQLVESVNATRTLFLHASRGGAVRVVMVTSAVKGEGKTSLAAHLAASLAYAGRKTVLVDCDLRSPSVHRLFDLPLGPGLAEVLRGECPTAAAIRPTSQPNLSVLPGGSVDARALQTLALADLGTTFGGLRRDFEYLVVDTPPVLPVADALLVSQHVDGVILSVLRNVSRIPRVREAHDRLSTLGVRVLGAVVNGVATSPGYYY